MQPSTWNDTNQHWTPQFLLKGFGLKGKASRVLRLDKTTGTIEVCKVSEVASKQRLLTDADDGLMRSIEQDATPVIEKIRKGTTSITRRERKSLDRLVAAMLINDPYNGIDKANVREEIIASTAGELTDAFMSSGGLVNEQDTKEFVDERLTHDYLKLLFDGEDNGILTVLGSMGLTANYATQDGSFIIGDSPVLAVRTSVGGDRDLRNPGSQVILPINSKCLLVYLWVTKKNLLEKGPVIDNEKALTLNRDYYHESNCRFLYGRTGDSLEKSRMLAIKWTPRTRDTRVSDDWYAMQTQLREQDERHQSQKMANKEGLLRAARQAVERARIGEIG